MIVRFGAIGSLAIGAALVAVSALPAGSAGGTSIKEVFEKHGLVGAYAWDCSKDPDQKSNWYFVNRVMDADHVQRDFMGGTTTRLWYTILDKAEERGGGEIYVSGVRDGKPTDGIWRIENNRMLQVEATLDGKTTIRGGKWVDTGKDMLWLNRCGN
jgi:hypothetical protein